MKVAYYSEKLNKYFDTEDECKRAEASLTAESDSLMALQAELDDISERVDLLVEKTKKHYETYGSINLKMKLGDKTFPLVFNNKKAAPKKVNEPIKRSSTSTNLFDDLAELTSLFF